MMRASNWTNPRDPVYILVKQHYRGNQTVIRCPEELVEMAKILSFPETLVMFQVEKVAEGPMATILDVMAILGGDPASPVDEG